MADDRVVPTYGERVCCQCTRPLSLYNPDERCAACQHARAEERLRRLAQYVERSTEAGRLN